MRTVQRGWGLAMAAILILALSGTWAGAAPTRGCTLTVGLEADPPTIDPHAVVSAVPYQITSSVMESLMFKGTDGTASAGLTLGGRRAMALLPRTALQTLFITAIALAGFAV